MNVEFVPEPSASDGPSDELDARPPRTPRWVPVTVAAVLVGGAIAIVAQRSSAPVPRAAPAPSTSPSSSAPSYPFPRDTVVPDQISTLDPTLFGVYNTALDSAPAQTIVRNGSTTGSCRLAKIGTRPQAVIARTLVRTLTGFGHVDTAVIIDQDAGLCSVQVRARDGLGNVTVLRVTAPDGNRGTEFVHGGDGTISGTRVEYAEYRSDRGWHVVAGVAGPSSGRDRLPLRSVLQTLAMDTSLRW